MLKVIWIDLWSSCRLTKLELLKLTSVRGMSHARKSWFASRRTPSVNQPCYWGALLLQEEEILTL